MSYTGPSRPRPGRDVPQVVLVDVGSLRIVQRAGGGAERYEVSVGGFGDTGVRHTVTCNLDALLQVARAIEREADTMHAGVAR